MSLNFGEQDKSHLSLSQEQLVASHHTQLAMVTGLCQEEMVLLKQINSGQKVDQLFLDENLIKKVLSLFFNVAMISSSRRTQKISDHIAPLLLRKDENYFLTCKTYL